MEIRAKTHCIGGGTSMWGTPRQPHIKNPRLLIPASHFGFDSVVFLHPKTADPTRPGQWRSCINREVRMKFSNPNRNRGGNRARKGDPNSQKGSDDPSDAPLDGDNIKVASADGYRVRFDRKERR